MATVTQALCYHVYATDEGWEVALDHQPPLRLFASKHAALSAARTAAEARWLLTGNPTDVGFGKQGDDIIIDSSYA